MSTSQYNSSSREQIRNMKLNALKILGISALVAGLVIGAVLFFPITVSIALLSFAFVGAVASYIAAIFFFDKNYKAPQGPRSDGFTTTFDQSLFESTYDNPPSPYSASTGFFDVPNVGSHSTSRFASNDDVALENDHDAEETSSTKSQL